MTTHKNQHWIPRSYIKAWCDPNHKNKVVHKYDCDGNYQGWRPPSRIFSGDDLYTVMSNGRRDLHTEHVLKKIEDLFLTTRKALTDGGALNERHKSIMAFYVAAMRNRSPQARDHWQAFKDRVISAGSAMEQSLIRATPEERARLRSAAIHSGGDRANSFSLDEARAAAAEPFGKWLLRHIKIEAEVLERLDLVILEAAEGIGFITSDSPVVWYNTARPTNRQGRFGLGSPDIEVTMPLSPRLCALFDHAGQQGRAIVDQHGVDTINSRTLAHCDNLFIASSSELVVDWLEQ